MQQLKRYQIKLVICKNRNISKKEVYKKVCLNKTIELKLSPQNTSEIMQWTTTLGFKKKQT